MSKLHTTFLSMSLMFSKTSIDHTVKESQKVSADLLDNILFMKKA